jgi:threonine-phosphate decarboxylase
VTNSAHGGNIAQVCETHGLRPDEITDFSANINPLGYSPGLPARISRELQSVLHYPDIDAAPLRTAVSSHISRHEDEILIGNGSTEHIYLLPRILRPETGIVFEPTYSDYARAMKNAGADVTEIMRKTETFEADLNYPAIGSKTGANTMLYLCNPNNPTGTLTKKEEILSLARRCPDMCIVIDEAFMDFVADGYKFSVLKDAGAGSLRNIIVLRSMTKFHGFPGLRLGYTVAHTDIIERLRALKEPWTVNTLAQAAGLLALEDNDYIEKSREFVAAEKDFLYRQLSAIDGLRPIPPSVNFILVRISDDGPTSHELQESLIGMGILIRDCSNFRGLGDKYFRVAVRTRDENVKLVSCLESSLKGLVVK